MERTYKFRLYPTGKQVAILNRSIALCRRLYNNSLEERIKTHEAGVPTTCTEQQRNLKSLKNTSIEYSDVYSHSLQDVIKRLDKACKGFFRRVKAGQKPGFPRFKSERRYRSITYDRYGFRIRENGRLYLTKIGEIRMFKHRAIEGELRVCTIKRDAVGDWWATISVVQPDVAPIVPKTAIGVDVGLEKLATLSTGEVIERHRFIKESGKNVKRLQREVSRKKKGSANRAKCVQRLAKAHRKVERQRDDYLHKSSRILVGKADVVVFENLNIGNMQKNHRLAQSISDASWGKLMQYTVYKAESAGRYVCFVSPDDTSQMCSRCGAMVKKSLSERFHVCTNCGFSVDRDFNASLNILGRLPTDSGELCKTPVETVPLPSLVGGGKNGP